MWQHEHLVKTISGGQFMIDAIYLLVELGGEKRSIAGAETGDESAVAGPTFFWSSLRRCSYNNTSASVSSTEGNWYSTSSPDT